MQCNYIKEGQLQQINPQSTARQTGGDNSLPPTYIRYEQDKLRKYCKYYGSWINNTLDKIGGSKESQGMPMVVTVKHKASPIPKKVGLQRHMHRAGHTHLHE